jgi:hypothetical protein
MGEQHIRSMLLSLIVGSLFSASAEAQEWFIGPNPDRMGPEREMLQAELRQDGRTISFRAYCGEAFGLVGFTPALKIEVDALGGFGGAVPVRTTVEMNMAGGYSTVTNLRFRADNGHTSIGQPATEDPRLVEYSLVRRHFGESIDSAFPFLIELDYFGGASIVELPRTRVVMDYVSQCITPDESPSEAPRKADVP